MSWLTPLHPLRELRHEMGRWQREMDQMLGHWGLELPTREEPPLSTMSPKRASHAGSAPGAVEASDQQGNGRPEGQPIC
jgi:hypothetical protein